MQLILPSLSTLVIVTVLYGLLLALLRRTYTAGALVLYFLCFALLSSYMKQSYLGSAMTLADMHFFFLRPLENFYILVNYPVLGFTALGVLGLVALVAYLGIRFERPIQKANTPLVKRWWRVGTVSSALALGVCALLMSDRQSHAEAGEGDAYAAFLSMYEQQHPKGPINRLNIFFNNRSFEAKLPTERMQQRFAKSEPNEAESSVSTPESRPDILLVLEESTFDATLIKSCPKTECDNAMLHPLPVAKRTQQGPMLVHTSGGGTWLAEFAVLSGFDWRVFGRGGAYAPVSLAPRLKASLPLRLRSLGYRTIAIYPTEGNFLSATTAYEHYGFEEFYDQNALKLPSEWKDVPDTLVFEKIEQVVNRQSDARPLFIFALTIRNHGPHGGAPAVIPKPFASVVGKMSDRMADYLVRMRASSNAYVEFATRWLNSPKPRVIAWFGDHQPEAAWDFTEHPAKLRAERAANVTDSQLQYLTYYQLSANYGEKEQHIARDAVDLSYLGSELLAFARLPLDSGFAASRRVADECNGLLISCADRALINDYLSFRVHQLGEVH